MEMNRFFSRYLSPMFKIDSALFGPQRNFCQEQQTTQYKEENPFMKKYADRIAALQRSSPEEHKCRAERFDKTVKFKSNSTLLPRQSSSANESNPEHKFFYQNKTLDAIMKLDLLQDKSEKEIEIIWKQYHKGKDGLYAVLPSDAYEKIFMKLQTYPMFLFPLPRAQGYEFILSQFSGNSCYFTPLVNYQAYKENAPICLTVTYFSELQKTKGIVLMRGEYDENILKAHEAQCLTNQLQLYYGDANEKKNRLLLQFNKQPDTFKHMDLISELEYGLRN